MFLNIKYQLLIILSLTALTYTHAQKQKTDLNKMDLSGQIKTLSRIEYSVNSDTIFKQEASFVTTFNKKGYSLHLEHYNRDLFLDYKIIFEYDKKNRLIRSIKYKVYEFADSMFSSKDTLIYFPEEKKIITETYISRGVLQSRTVSEKRLTKIIAYHADGSVNYTRAQTFNNRGQLISTESYAKDNIVMSRMEWKHFKRKILIKRYKKGGVLVAASIQKLDKYGNLISWDYPTLKKENKYEYKYDDQNNWIQKITYRKGKLRSKVERIITYY
jgi:hypothetical protein